MQETMSEAHREGMLAYRAQRSAKHRAGSLPTAAPLKVNPYRGGNHSNELLAWVWNLGWMLAEFLEKEGHG